MGLPGIFLPHVFAHVHCYSTHWYYPTYDTHSQHRIEIEISGMSLFLYEKLDVKYL